MDGTKSSIRETTVVDSDIHLTITPEMVAEYVDDKHRYSVENGYVFPDSVWDFSVEGKIDDERFFEFTDVEAVREFLEEYHVDHPIINTFEPLDKFPTELSTDFMEAYNDLLIERFLHKDDQLLGLAGISLRDPEKAAEEIERISNEDQIVGVYIGNNAVTPPLGDSRYDVVYRAAEDNGLSVAFHANADGFVRDFPIQNRGFETYLEVHAVNHLWHQTMAVTSLVIQGAPAKFPDLNFIVLEAGISWIPYVMMRLNREYGMRRSEAPLLKKSPEEYIRDSFYFSTQPIGEPLDKRHMRKIIEIVGTDSLIFSSDYPHWDFDNPSEVDRHLRRQFSEEELEQVLFETPNEAWNLGL